MVNTGVPDDINQGPVSLRSGRVMVLLLCMSAHWKGSGILNAVMIHVDMAAVKNVYFTE